MTKEEQQALIRLAREKYGTDDVEIDDVLQDSIFSEADDGTWVRAWVWILNDKLEEALNELSRKQPALCP